MGSAAAVAVSGAGRKGRRPSGWRGGAGAEQEPRQCPNRAEVLTGAAEGVEGAGVCAVLIATDDPTDRAHGVVGVMSGPGSRGGGGGAWMSGHVPACAVDRFGRVAGAPLAQSRPRRYAPGTMQERRVRVIVNGRRMELRELVGDDTRADDLYTRQALWAAELGEDVARLDPWARGRSLDVRVREFLARQPVGGSAAAGRAIGSRRAVDAASIVRVLRQRERAVEDDRRTAEQVLAEYEAGGVVA
jgi:hypothetical protein